MKSHKSHIWVSITLVFTQVFCGAALSQNDQNREQDTWATKRGVSTGSGVFGWAQTNTSVRGNSDNTRRSGGRKGSTHAPTYRSPGNSGSKGQTSNQWQSTPGIGRGSTGLGGKLSISGRGQALSSGGWGAERASGGSVSSHLGFERAGDWGLSSHGASERAGQALSDHSSHGLSDYSTSHGLGAHSSALSQKESERSTAWGPAGAGRVTAWGHSDSERATAQGRGPAEHAWGHSATDHPTGWGHSASGTTGWGHTATGTTGWGHTATERTTGWGQAPTERSTGWGHRDSSERSSTYGRGTSYGTSYGAQTGSRLGSAYGRSSYHY